MYNSNAKFKKGVDDFIAKLKGNQTADATSGTNDSGTVVAADDTTTTPTAITPAAVTPTYVVAPGTVTLASVNKENCKAAYGGGCTSECKAKGSTSEECLTCTATCGAGTVTVVKKANSNNNQNKKEQRTGSSSGSGKSSGTSTPMSPSHKTTAAENKGIAAKDIGKSPFTTTKKSGCPARCEPFRLSSPATYATCCKGAK